MSPTLRPVIVTHPYRQHAYETAVAAQEGGLLECFVTGLYRTGHGLGAGRLGLEGALARRWHPELDPRLVVTVPAYQLVDLARRQAPLLRRWDSTAWMDERFDAAVARRLRRRPPRVVHGFEGSVLATFREARALGVATLLDVPSAHEAYAREIVREGGNVGGFRTARLQAERQLADHLLAGSEAVAACLEENGVAPERVVVLRYGADPERFAPPAEPHADGVFRALFVGQIGLRKGVRYLLEAWRRLALPDAELLLVGAADAEGLAVLREFAGLYRWVGQVQPLEIDRFYRESDAFVLPSLAEGSALVTYEAMASGLALVVTPESGSVARDGVDGFVVPARDVDALCERLRFLHGHPGARRRLGTSGRALIESTYTWRHYRERLRGVYRAVLEGRDP